MVELKLDIPKSFLESEVRCGYEVSTQMKKVWAVELDLLIEAKRVFEKYNIRWYAIGGTLLGAVRHNGFIPWDDDIDIAIPRTDYERLRSVARKEFSPPYYFQDEFNSPGLLCGHAKLRNSDTTMLLSCNLNEKEGKMSFNMGVFIDFFPVDNLPDDLEEKNEWLKRIRRLGQKAWNLRLFTHRGRLVEGNKAKYIFLRFLLSVFGDSNYFFKKYNRLLSKYSDVSTTKSCLYCLFCREKAGGTKWLWNSTDLDTKNLILLPFEFIKIPCLSNYDAVLTQTYGNWHEMKQVNSVHGCVQESFYDVEHPYHHYFDENGNLDRRLVHKAIELQKQITK